MEDKTTQPASIDAVLELIKQEVSFQESQQAAQSDYHVLDKQPPQLNEFEAFEFEQKGDYHRDEFLIYDDMEFVEKAFLGILQRQADETGMSGYVNFLRNGGSKIEVLLDMQSSAEAKAKHVAVAGLKWFRVRAKLTRLFPNSKFVHQRLARLDQLLLPWFAADAPHQTLFLLQRDVYRFGRSLKGHYEQYWQEVRTTQETQAKSVQRLQEHTQNMQRQLTSYRLHTQNLLASLNHSYAHPNEDNVAVPVIEQVKLDAFYLAFEDRCRGDLQAGLDKMQPYLPYVASTKQAFDGRIKAVDLGCGRGEWLHLMQQLDVPCLGVDTSLSMFNACQQAGYDVVQEDAYNWLTAQPDNSYHLVSSFHVFEHLPFVDLYAWFEQIARVLKPGGVLIFETPNPENVLVGSHTFFHDPTHRNPLTPTLMEFMVQFFGLDLQAIERLNPYPEEAKVKGHDPLTERVNGHLCGPQDFGMVATKAVEIDL